MKIVEQILRCHPQAPEQYGSVEFAPAIDADIEDISRVEFEIDPRAAIGNDSSRVKQLAAGMGLPFVMFEEDPW